MRWVRNPMPLCPYAPTPAPAPLLPFAAENARGIDRQIDTIVFLPNVKYANRLIVFVKDTLDNISFNTTSVYFK